MGYNEVLLRRPEMLCDGAEDGDDKKAKCSGIIYLRMRRGMLGESKPEARAKKSGQFSPVQQKAISGTDEVTAYD